MLQCVAVCRSVLKCVAVYCSVPYPRENAVCCCEALLQVCCSVLQCAAAWHSVFHCVVVCYNVLQCVDCVVVCATVCVCVQTVEVKIVCGNCRVLYP